ncbi:hypothetical protein [Roseibium suaedae]|uniref:Uncharacterized protein n=1 Tax=Roseibium suaedae TaxID=735517 RepID=A0A1M7PIV5_9HYPH|nr:hypothetical protein [Roseibium suaedae]SHN17046.1 hypothetical protein SAMN05444272_4447 [Roseibium suaedae]
MVSFVENFDGLLREFTRLTPIRNPSGPPLRCGRWRCGPAPDAASIGFAPFEINKTETSMKKIFSYLKRTSRDVFAYFGKLLKKGRSNGQFSISVTIGLPPFVSIRFGYNVDLKSDNDNAKAAKTG